MLTQARDGFGFEQIAVGGAAIGATAATANLTNSGQPATAVLITVETNSIRIRYDGVNPTAAIGHLLVAGDSIKIEGTGNIRKLRMIQQTAGAVVNLTYER